VAVSFFNRAQEIRIDKELCRQSRGSREVRPRLASEASKMKSLRLEQSERRLLVILLAGCVLGSELVLPYLLHLQKLPLTDLPNLARKTALNSLVTFAVLIYLGVLLKRRVPVAGGPFLEGKQSVSGLRFLKWGVGPGLDIVYIWYVEYFPGKERRQGSHQGAERNPGKVREVERYGSASKAQKVSLRSRAFAIML
jgi:hypothetical protein